MTTLEAIQELSDGAFHLLGDELLRRMEPRYRHLRAHGVNALGESIKGQPDSYVGQTAASCSIAVCYTVQRENWWSKVVDDVKKAFAASPSVQEVVAVISRDADREGPKKKGSQEKIDWLADAKAAARGETFRLIDGPKMAQILDTDHQDLRYQHLRIPYSRLSGSSILASSQLATAETLDSILQSGRYDPDRYTSRSADIELYRLWQQCLRGNGDGKSRNAPVRMIALVSDSGLGKTSLVCCFARSLSAVLPVILVQVRNLAFSGEEALVSYVVHVLQGVLDPSVRVGEEVALTKHLPVTSPLTLIVDGLDEAHAPEAVRKSISFWLHSRIGQASVLITTSRSEFWKTCSEQHWGRWMPEYAPDERSPASVAHGSEVRSTGPDVGFCLPDLFTETELEASWVKAGRPRAELYLLPAEAREELRHPFTLRIYLDLCVNAANLPQILNRSELIERWLDQRLTVEANQEDRTTRDLFNKTLKIIAVKTTANAGAVSVDSLTDVPRFDTQHPPGPVVQALIEASILETVPEHADRLRFAVEAIQDFYRAEADVELIRLDPASVAQQFAALRFTDAYPRLTRIGRRLQMDDIRHAFVTTLADIAPRIAAIILAAAPLQYAPGLRQKIACALAQDIDKRHRVRGAFAIDMLGALNCPEAVDVLVRSLFPPASPHQYIKAIGANALVKLGHPAAAEFVYLWERLGVRRNETYYFPEELILLRHAKLEFRKALAQQARQHLNSVSGNLEHVRAVYVLACLGDESLVGHLAGRLATNGALRRYENHALVAIGTDSAGSLFAQSVMVTGEKLAKIPDDAAHNEARHALMYPVHLLTYDIRYLMTPAFEPYLLSLINHDDPHVSWIASSLAKTGAVTSLFLQTAIASARTDALYSPHDAERSMVMPELWLAWWQSASDPSVRKTLLGIAPLVPSAELEDALLECLEVKELRGQAARLLGSYGAVRAAPPCVRFSQQMKGRIRHWAK
jgi:hypothetical protein